MFVFEGGGLLGEEGVSEVNAYTLAPGKEVFTAGNGKVQFIFAEGRPLRQAIAWRGPIAMNTQKELIETLRDLENDRFIEGNKEV